MTQYEQENDLGRGGGEVDDETMERAWETAESRRNPDASEDEPASEDDAPDAAQDLG